MTVAVMIGLIVIVLPLCGSNGAALTPCLAFWLLLAAHRRWYSGDRPGKRDAVVLLAQVLTAAAVFLVYVVGLADPKRSTPTPEQFLRAFCQVCTTSLGSLESFGGIRTETGWPLLAPIVFGGTMLAAAMLGARWRRRPEHRLRTEGFLLYLGAFASVAVGVAWGRGHAGPLAGFAHHYVILLVPALVALYFVGVTHDTEPLGRLLRMLLFVAAAVLLLSNTTAGLRQGKERIVPLAQIEQAIRAGRSSRSIADRYHERLFYKKDPDYVAQCLEMLRADGIQPFGR